MPELISTEKMTTRDGVDIRINYFIEINNILKVRLESCIKFVFQNHNWTRTLGEVTFNVGDEAAWGLSSSGGAAFVAVDEADINIVHVKKKFIDILDIPSPNPNLAASGVILHELQHLRHFKEQTAKNIYESENRLEKSLDKRQAYKIESMLIDLRKSAKELFDLVYVEGVATATQYQVAYKTIPSSFIISSYADAKKIVDDLVRLWNEIIHMFNEPLNDKKITSLSGLIMDFKRGTNKVKYLLGFHMVLVVCAFFSDLESKELLSFSHIQFMKRYESAFYNVPELKNYKILATLNSGKGMVDYNSMTVQLSKTYEILKDAGRLKGGVFEKIRRFFRK